MAGSKYNYDYFDTSLYGLEPFANGSPRIGECASDFKARTLDGRVARLSDFKGKTIILETGSLTCPMFAGNISAMNAIADRFSGDDVVFLILYTREAHPASKTPAHRSIADKLAVARRTAESVSRHRIFLVDDVDGSAHRLWGEFPNSLWLIGPDGVVQYRTDWNQPHTLVQLLEAEDRGRLVSQLSEHNKPSLGKEAPRIFRYLISKAGWGSIWDMITQIGGMRARHKEVDSYYANRKYAPGSPNRVGGCW